MPSNISTSNYMSPFWFDWTSSLSAWPLMIYPNACINVSGIPNCDATCSNAESLWNESNTLAMYTLHNCISYPIISHLWQTGHLTGDAINVAKSLGMKENPSSIITNLTLLENCIHDFCDTDDKTDSCNQPPHPQDRADDSDNILYTTNYNFNPSICDGLKAEINSDVGGIGVFIAYLMQVGLSFLAWLVFHVTIGWRKYISDWRDRRSETPKAVQASGTTHGGVQPRSLSRNDFLHALKDFHVTQVFFMMAVQIAALIAIGNPKSLDSASWQQFWNNVGVFYDLALGGCLPLLIILLLLRKARYRGWFTLVMTSTSVSLATATWFRTYFVLDYGDENKELGYVKPKLGPPTCGNISPTTYCFEGEWSLDNPVGNWNAVYMLSFCLIVVGFMWIDQLRIIGQPKGKSWRKLDYDGVNAFEALHNKVAIASKHVRWLSWMNEDVLDIVERVIVFLAEITLLGLMGLLMKDYTAILFTRWNFSMLDRTDWSFGQIVAVTIWLPVICKSLWNFTEILMGVPQNKGNGPGIKRLSSINLGAASSLGIELELGNSSKTPLVHEDLQITRANPRPYSWAGQST